MGSTRQGAPQIMFCHFVRYRLVLQDLQGSYGAVGPVGQLSVSVAGDVQRFWGFVRHSFERRSKVPGLSSVE